MCTTKLLSQKSCRGTRNSHRTHLADSDLFSFGLSWFYKQQVERRRKNRLKGPQLYDLAKLENDIRQLEWKRLESIHEANAEDAEYNAALFDLNLGLKEYRDEWN